MPEQSINGDYNMRMSSTVAITFLMATVCLGQAPAPQGTRGAAAAGRGNARALESPTATVKFDKPATITLTPGNATLREIVAGISPANIHDDVAHIVSFGTRLSVDETGTPNPATDGARDWIVDQFKKYSAASGGRLQVKVDTFPVPVGSRVPKAGTMSNVIATLPGDDPQNHQVFIIGGDFDSIGGFGGGATDRTPTVGPGANDDASGVAIALECARVMSLHHFPATIEFIAYDGEEEGLYGAYHDAELAKANGQNVTAMLDNDIVGGDNTPGHANTDSMRVYSPGLSETPTPDEITSLADLGGENDSMPRELGRYASGIAQVYIPAFHVVQEYRQDRFGRGGDDAAYLQNGFTGVRFSDYYENYDHQHQWVRKYDGVQFGDLIEFTTPSYTANIGRVNALTTAALALAPPTPGPIQQRRAGWGTHLSWNAVPGAVSYRVLLRPTAEPQWSKRYVVKGTEIQIEETLDDYIMGVVSVGADGTESLPSVPQVIVHRRPSPFAPR